MKTQLVAVTLLVALTGNVPAAEDDRLAEFFKAYLEEEFRARPLAATQLGDHRYDHLLDDVSPKARAGWTARYRSALTDLPKKVDYAKLSRSGQIDFGQYAAVTWLQRRCCGAAGRPRRCFSRICRDIGLTRNLPHGNDSDNSRK
jgi:hypothetical protein